MSDSHRVISVSDQNDNLQKVDDGFQKACNRVMDIKVNQSSPGITALATAPTAFAVTFTPVATTVTAASATATTAQPCMLRTMLMPTTTLRAECNVESVIGSGVFI